jgi:caspase domain-containing protein
MSHSTPVRAHAAVIAILLTAAIVALVRTDAERDKTTALPPPAVGTPLASVPFSPPAPNPQGPAGAVDPGPGHIQTRGGRLVVPDEQGSTSIARAPSSSAGSSFASRYPAQVNATRQDGLPASNYWALLIGINDYAGSTRDNIGSYQDASALASYMVSLGWQSDHILVMANRDATAGQIVEGMRWLQSKTDDSSVVVFHYSGHEQPTRSSSDGDNESRDVALWAADNRLVLDGVLGRELGRVRSASMWVNLAVCRAGGFSDPGTTGPGRIVTFSSPESELSYEDPTVKHSVYGWFTIVEGMRQGLADANGDSVVTVEEAWRYARPYVTDRTDGRQHPAVSDQFDGEFSLIPPDPPPPPPPPGGGGGSGCGIVIVCNSARRSW